MVRETLVKGLPLSSSQTAACRITAQRGRSIERSLIGGSRLLGTGLGFGRLSARTIRLGGIAVVSLSVSVVLPVSVGPVSTIRSPWGIRDASS
jgi:hypothetical protein